MKRYELNHFSVGLKAVWGQVGFSFLYKKKPLETMTFLSDGGGRMSLKPLNDEFQMGKVAQITHLHTVWRQIPMRNQLFTCISKIGEDNGR